MKVLLIDADSKIPNLALMKLSAYHKQCGDTVDLVKFNIPYYPNKKREMKYVPWGYDKSYCSVIFDGSKDWISGNADFGGTGYSLNKNLSEEIENIEPDYSIYPDNNKSYGFISRGCIRKCSFCKVPEKEGYIRQVSQVKDIVRHKTTMFMDNNILALPSHKDILKEIIDLNIKCQFNQGLDIRLLDRENSTLLSKLNYSGNYIFAFDNWAYKDIIQGKMELLEWKKDWQLKFFVYVNPEMPIPDTVKRIEWLKDNKCLPYIMRDISCWESELNEFYIDLASWCNQPGLFKKMIFEEFLNKRHTGGNAKDRIRTSLSHYTKQ